MRFLISIKTDNVLILLIKKEPQVSILGFFVCFIKFIISVGPGQSGGAWCYILGRNCVQRTQIVPRCP